MSIQTGHEEITKTGSTRPRASLKLKPTETLLGRPQTPASIGVQPFDRLSLVVQRTDVAHLDGVAVPVLDPAQWKPLSSTHVGAVSINSTGAHFIQEGATARGMRHTRRQQLGMTVANVFRLDVEHG